MQNALTVRRWLIACAVVSMLAGCNRSKTDAARESGATEGSFFGRLVSMIRTSGVRTGEAGQ